MICEIFPCIDQINSITEVKSAFNKLERVKYCMVRKRYIIIQIWKNKTANIIPYYMSVTDESYVDETRVWRTKL